MPEPTRGRLPLLKCGLLGALLTLASPLAASAAPPQSSADVTITVIDDPAQLNEQVNTLTLPGSEGDDSAQAPAGTNKNEPNASLSEDANKASADHNAANDTAAGNDSNQ